MRIFQACFFIVEIIFFLIVGLMIALNFKLSFNNRKYTMKEKHNYIYVESIYERKRWGIRDVNLWKVAWFIIVISITIYFIRPFLLDVPQLITGKLNYITGEVQDIRHFSKDPIQYVYLSGGEEVEFFFSSGVSEYKYYKIGYLTHTKRAIYCEQIEEGSGYRKVINFPFKDILVYLTILGIFLFLIFISPYNKGSSILLGTLPQAA
jgi:hypothetical protein